MNYNYIVNAHYNYVSNKGLLGEIDKEENLEKTGAAATSCLKKRLQKVCPMSCIRPDTARTAPQ